ncbi:MAG: hypothetical protein LBR29_04465 [Methylobacteriaceae bacterium]|nr:hypothetical protein [Methylobacteriaceae bacterium]
MPRTLIALLAGVLLSSCVSGQQDGTAEPTRPPGPVPAQTREELAMGAPLFTNLAGVQISDIIYLPGKGYWLRKGGGKAVICTKITIRDPKGGLHDYWARSIIDNQDELSATQYPANDLCAGQMQGNTLSPFPEFMKYQQSAVRAGLEVPREKRWYNTNRW